MVWSMKRRIGNAYERWVIKCERKMIGANEVKKGK